MPLKRLKWIAERTLKEAPFSHLSQLPFYMTSTYIHMSHEKADIIHAIWATPMGYLASLNLQNTPYIITCHGSDCTLPLSNTIIRLFTQRALKKAARIVAVSEYVKQLAIRLGVSRDKVIVNYLGIDTQKFKPSSNRKQLRDKFNIPFDTIVIGSLGRLIPSKRVHDLLKAAA